MKCETSLKSFLEKRFKFRAQSVHSIVFPINVVIDCDFMNELTFFHETCLAAPFIDVSRQNLFIFNFQFLFVYYIALCITSQNK